MECEQRALRDSELALLKALEGVMSGYDAELAFRTATKYAITAEQAKRAECCTHNRSVCDDYQHENPFAALAIAAERRLSDYNPSLIQMALWAFSRRECVLVS